MFEGYFVDRLTFRICFGLIAVLLSVTTVVGPFRISFGFSFSKAKLSFGSPPTGMTTVLSPGDKTLASLNSAAGIRYNDNHHHNVEERKSTECFLSRTIPT